jgi:hypothetical protein
MELTHTKVEASSYYLTFEGVIENQLVKVDVEFYEVWSFTNPLKKSKLLEDFGNTIGFFVKGKQTSFPINLKEYLKTIPLHIPHALGRQLFKQCFDFFIKYTEAPVHVSIVEHPGYPLAIVTYDSSIISKEETVERWINTIMDSIQTCGFIVEPLDKEQGPAEEDYDEVDEDVYVEFELEDEIAELIKVPAEPEYLPLEGEEDE